MAEPSIIPDPKALFSLLSTGDEQAFAELFYFYTPRLYPFILRKVRVEEVAEELVQDIFLKLWVYREKIAGLDDPEKYLFRIAVNRIQDHFRDLRLRARLQQELVRENAPVQRSADETMDLNRARALLRQGIQSLPFQRRRVYELRQEGLSYGEIAGQLDLSINTVKNQLVQANRSLLEFLRDHGLSVLLLILSWRRP